MVVAAIVGVLLVLLALGIIVNTTEIIILGRLGNELMATIDIAAETTILVKLQAEVLPFDLATINNQFASCSYGLQLRGALLKDELLVCQCITGRCPGQSFTKTKGKNKCVLCSFFLERELGQGDCLRLPSWHVEVINTEVLDGTAIACERSLDIETFAEVDSGVLVFKLKAVS